MLNPFLSLSNRHCIDLRWGESMRSWSLRDSSSLCYRYYVSSRSGATPPSKKFSLRSPVKLWNNNLSKHRRRRIRFIAARPAGWPPFDTILAPSINTVTSYKLGVVQSFALPKYGWWGRNWRHCLAPSPKNADYEGGSKLKSDGTRRYICVGVVDPWSFIKIGSSLPRHCSFNRFRWWRCFDDLRFLFFHNLAGERRLKFFKPGVAPLRLEA